MQNIEKIREEGLDFLNSGYADLPILAKIHVIAYMRGIKEGMALALAQKPKQDNS